MKNGFCESVPFHSAIPAFEVSDVTWQQVASEVSSDEKTHTGACGAGRKAGSSGWLRERTVIFASSSCKPCGPWSDMVETCDGEE